MSVSHSFNVAIAEEHGIEIALFLNHFSFWYTKAKGNAQNHHKNKVWVRMKASQIQEVYPYFTLRQVRYTIDKMVDLGLLLQDQFNTKNSDRTKWYTFTKKAKDLLKIQEDKSPKKEGYKNVTPQGYKNVSPSYKIVTSIYKEVDIISRYIQQHRKINENLGLLEDVAMKNKIDKNCMKDVVLDFIINQQNIGKIWMHDSDMFAHFRSWVKQQNYSENVDVELDWFMQKFNEVSKRTFVKTDTIQKRFVRQLSFGFTGKQMVKAVQNMYSSSVKNDYHLKTNFKFATPEYLLKDDNLNKYLNVKL